MPQATVNAAISLEVDGRLPCVMLRGAQDVSKKAGRSTSLGRRYAVVYILHGFTDNDNNWFALASHFVNVPAAMDFHT
jgi:S-formylglutathione hydrolase FrmB